MKKERKEEKEKGVQVEKRFLMGGEKMAMDFGSWGLGLGA